MSNTDKNIEAKLRSCIATQSMLDEMNISAILKSKNWYVTDNPYYIDQETKKYRELDVFGRRLVSQKKEDLTYDLQLIVESKSLTGYHILLSNEDKFISSENNSSWPGDQLDTRTEFLTKLRQLNFTDNEIESLFIKVKETFYINDSWLFSGYQFYYFNGLQSFYSFRETNTSITKDFNNSVVWKAFQELSSVSKYIQNRQFQNMLGDMEYYVKKKQRITYKVHLHLL